MKKTFKINGKEYAAKAFDFNLVCDLEDMGVSMQEMNKKPMATARAYFALCNGMGKEIAGKELEAHLISGGNFDEVIKVMLEEMEKSDFFRSLTESSEAEITENQSKKK